MASTPTTPYSSGLLDDFTSGKRSWKPKTPTSIKAKAKSADADLPSLFASAVSRSPARRRVNVTTPSKSTPDATSTSDTLKQTRQTTFGVSKPPLTPSTASDASHNVPSMFKSSVSSPSNRRSPSPSASKNASSLSPGKYKSKSGKIVITKRDFSPKRSASTERSSKDSGGTSTSSDTSASHQSKDNGLPLVTPTKSKIKIKSRSSQLDYEYSPKGKGKDVNMNAISNSMVERDEPFSDAKPKSLKMTNTRVTGEKEGEQRKPASFNISNDTSAPLKKVERDESLKRQPLCIRSSQTGKSATVTTKKNWEPTKSRKQPPVGYRISKEPEDVSAFKNDEKKLDGSSESKNVVSGKVTKDASGELADRAVSSRTEVPTSARNDSASSPPVDDDIATPLKSPPTSPRKPITYSAYTSSVPRSKNRVMALAPFSGDRRRLQPTERATTHIKGAPEPNLKHTPAPALQTFLNDGKSDRGTKTTIEKEEKIPLVSIDTSGGNPQMVISFDNDEYNPVDEDELSCSVATAMFGPPDYSPSKNLTVKATGGTKGPSDPATIVSLLSQEEQLELFRTLEKLHRNKNL
ncbi:hypothetical protein IV203_015399 [Nitzschia inconspicua]|uniref:Uncharacterized protein n=1 Tax=Nitzschia inconspicua TaxID=303405 RepID=A0A9K3PT38_9STRA|nr:hypothetical protein IV203_015399 [Nitzschia inconspicua]